MKVLALYDIHGNPDALTRYLAIRGRRELTSLWWVGTWFPARGNGEREVAEPA